MFDKLDSVMLHYEDIQRELASPDIASNQSRFRKLMKEQSDLAPIVEAYGAYRDCRRSAEESLQMLEEESDEEMRELAKEELAISKKREEELEEKIRILLIPKDPNDDKNVIVEIRAGAGGDEAALFAAEIYRMYVHYAEGRGWRSELLEYEEPQTASGSLSAWFGEPPLCSCRLIRQRRLQTCRTLPLRYCNGYTTFSHCRFYLFADARSP